MMWWYWFFVLYVPAFFTILVADLDLLLGASLTATVGMFCGALARLLENQKESR